MHAIYPSIPAHPFPSHPLVPSTPPIRFDELTILIIYYSWVQARGDLVESKEEKAVNDV
jgi:hypothetical protein